MHTCIITIISRSVARMVSPIVWLCAVRTFNLFSHHEPTTVMRLMSAFTNISYRLSDFRFVIFGYKNKAFKRLRSQSRQHSNWNGTNPIELNRVTMLPMMIMHFDPIFMLIWPTHMLKTTHRQTNTLMKCSTPSMLLPVFIFQSTITGGMSWKYNTNR